MGRLRDVLIVDDSSTMRMLISFALGKYAGCGIREAGSTAEGLERVAEQKPDLMVVGINMDGAGGLELISSVRARHEAGSLPIVVITSEGSDEDISKGLQAGATEYLVKPFQPHKLHAVVDRLFEKPQ